MPILCDYHMHSTFSGDAKSPLEDMVKYAISKGLKQICFTEHMDKCFPYIPGEEGMFELDTDAYLAELSRVRDIYADKIKVCFGVELGLQAVAVNDNISYAKKYDFDFVIASLHVVDGMDPYYPQYYEGKTEEEAYGLYFTRIYENLLAFDNFDSLGHLDYIVRYGKNRDRDYRYETYKDTIDRILKWLIENEKSLEVNTAGLRKGTKDVHPTRDILKRYKELGGKLITIGSDSHNICDIAADFDVAERVLKECGFDYYCMYDNRKPEFVGLV